MTEAAPQAVPQAVPFVPNDHSVMTAEEIRNTLWLEFRAPGLYAKPDSFIIVAPRPVEGMQTLWYVEQPEGTLFDVYFYNHPFANTLLAHIANMPCRDAFDSAFTYMPWYFHVMRTLNVPDAKDLFIVETGDVDPSYAVHEDAVIAARAIRAARAAGQSAQSHIAQVCERSVVDLTSILAG